MIGTPAPSEALDAYRSGLALCALVGLGSGVVALGLGGAPRASAALRAARPAEATS